MNTKNFSCKTFQQKTAKLMWLMEQAWGVTSWKPMTANDTPATFAQNMLILYRLLHFHSERRFNVSVSEKISIFKSVPEILKCWAVCALA